MHPDGFTFCTPPPLGAHGMIDGQDGTPKDFASPSSHRQQSISSPSVFISPSVVNDDRAEKKERRKSRIVEMQRRHLNSPASAPDRPMTGAPQGTLTNVQLSEHYTNCIKLSTENKINAKNAFGLHLIDYMSELLKKKEGTNFQMASSTLDASAKIYAGRVDAIHSETYKVLTGLGRGAEKGNKEDEAIESGKEEEQDGPPGAKRRKRTKKGKTIETNLKNINVHKLDLAFETDPLFHKTSAAFDEGGTAGLLLNHLHCRDDTSELVLDSALVMSELDGTHPIESAQQPDDSTPGAMRELKQMFLGLQLEGTQVCPEFSEFEFTNWNSDRGDGLSNVIQMAKSSHAFDLEAEAEPVPSSTDTDSEVAPDLPDDGFGPLAEYDEDDEDAAFHDGPANRSGESISLGDNKEAQMVKQTIKNIKHGTIGTLMQVLATEPSDYSYFNTNLLQTWAGPSHWKLGKKSKDAMGPHGDAPKKPREKKQAFVLDYDQEVDFDKHLKETRAATTLTKATLDKNSRNDTTLPEDLHYDEEKLFKPYSRPRVMIKRQKRRSSVSVDEQLDNYDYNNPNDKDNFCPAGVEDDGDDVDETAGGFDFSAGGMTQLSQSQELDGEVPGGSQDALMAFSGDNLVAQPRKVAKIDIAFAKAAKKMDVKRLKACLWGMLTTPETTSPKKTAPEDDPDKSKETSQEEDKEQDETKPGPSSAPIAPSDTALPVTPSDTALPHSFHQMVNELPNKLSKNMAKNLSVPIAFVCLLHLANEKTLSLEGSEDMADLTITQG